MGDNVRRYHAIRDALTQGYPGQSTGTVARVIAGCLLWYLLVFPLRGTDTVPFEVLVSSIEVDTARGHLLAFAISAPPASSGKAPSLTL